MNESFNDWKLISLSPLQSEFLALVIIVLVLIALRVAWSYRQGRRPWLLSALRIASIIATIFWLLEPAIQWQATRETKSRLAFVLDTSQSMQQKDGESKSRFSASLDFLKKELSQIDKLTQGRSVEFHDLNSEISLNSKLSANDDTTDLLLALEKARDADPSRPMAAFILLSDGIDHGALATPTERANPGVLERIKALGAPVNIIDTSAGRHFRDLAIASLRTDEFAFVHNSFEIEVSASSAGYGDVSPTLILRENGAVIETQEVHIPSGEVAHLKFKTKPTTVGPRAYSVEITPFADEAVTSNNIETFAVDVVRDKIRVLQVVGRPSWDERFLRQHLKENPNVDLISFFILRTPSDATGAPEKELALIPFPVERLFTTELKTFDVIVFQNFDFGPYRMEPYLRNIQQAVLDGLGFVMIGGNKSFGSGGYEGTPIETILPLRVANSDYIQQTIAPRLTPTGARHPILALGLWGGAPGELWKRLPSFRGYNKTLGLSPGAIALATHPADRGIDGKPLPLIAAREVQKGRSLAIATDNLWRWRFSSHADSDLAARAYHRFWANALRWLVRDPSHSRVKVRPLHRRIGKNEALVLKIETREQDYSPAPFSSATVQILDGQGTLLQTRTIELGENATGVAKLENLPKGALHIRVNAHLGNRDLGQTETVVVVEEDSQETTALTPNPEILRYLSEKSGGSWQALGDANLADLIIPDATRIEIDRIKNQPLWDNAWALGLAILLFGLDWALRRRMGYV